MIEPQAYREETKGLLQMFSCVRRGTILPASFGRSYAWSESDVLSFWDSLVAGIPTGRYVSWHCGVVHYQDGSGRARLGPVPLPTVDCREILLDGHCRFATLAWSFRMPDEPLPGDLSEAEAAVWGTGRILVADLARRCMRFASPDECASSPRDVMPAGAMISTPRFAKWSRLATGGDDPVPADRMDWVDVISSRVRDAKATDGVIRSARIADALLVMDRVGNSGVRADDATLDAVRTAARMCQS